MTAIVCRGIVDAGPIPFRLMDMMARGEESAAGNVILPVVVIAVMIVGPLRDCLVVYQTKPVRKFSEFSKSGCLAKKKKSIHDMPLADSPWFFCGHIRNQHDSRDSEIRLDRHLN